MMASRVGLCLEFRITTSPSLSPSLNLPLIQSCHRGAGTERNARSGPTYRVYQVMHRKHQVLPALASAPQPTIMTFPPCSSLEVFVFIKNILKNFTFFFKNRLSCQSELKSKKINISSVPEKFT